MIITVMIVEGSCLEESILHWSFKKKSWMYYENILYILELTSSFSKIDFTFFRFLTPVTWNINITNHI